VNGTSPPARGLRGEARVSSGFDLNAVVSQVRHAFREEDAGFVGGSDTYGVHVTPDGRAVLTPVRWESSASGPRVPRAGAPVLVETVALGRDVEALDGSTGTALVTDSGGVAIPRGEVVETLENTSLGLEQSWRFPRPPVGTGDLTVRVAVQGLGYAGESALGLHFLDEASGLGFRYGSAYWIDALGQVTKVQTVYEGEAVVITVPKDVLDGSVFPAVLDPTITPEFGIDTPVVSPNHQVSPDVAFDGTNYLVVWQDFAPDHPSTSSRIYGARVGPSGNVFDGRGFPISQEPEGRAAFRPRVAFRGYDYLVVWTSWAVQEQADGSVASSDSQIRARYVNNWGQMWGSDKLVATGGEDAAVAPSAAEFMVAWTDPGKVARVTAMRNGVPVTPGGVAVATSGVFESCRLAFDGSSYLLIAKHRPALNSTDVSIQAIRLNGDGAVLTSPLVLDASAGVSSPAVAYASGTYLVAWSRASDASVAHVRLNTTGALLDASPVLTASGESALVAHVAGSPTGFYVGRTTPSGARAGYWVMRVESSGLVAWDVRVQALPNGPPSATWGDGRLLAVSEMNAP
jgi:hypothetical protein